MTVAELINKLQSINPANKDAHIVIDIGHENYRDIGTDVENDDIVKDYDFAPDIEFDGEPLADEDGNAYRKVLPIFIFHSSKR